MSTRAARFDALWLGGGVILVALVFGVLPTLRLLWQAVDGGVPAWTAVLAQDITWRATWNSLVVSAGGTALAVLLGGALALLIGLTDLRWRNTLVFLFVLPLVIAPQVLAVAWIQLMGPNSTVLRWIGLAPPPGTPNPLYGAGGIIVLLGIQYAPLVFIGLRAALRSLPRDLSEAARAHGAGPFTCIATVIVPLLTPALAAVALLSFVSCLGNFGVPAFLGIPASYPVLPTLIYQRFAGLGPSVLAEVAVLALLVGGLALVGVLWQARLLRRSDCRIAASRSSERLFSLGRWRAPVEIALFVLLAAIVVAPLVSLLITSLLPALGVRFDWGRLSLAHYQFVLFEHAATRRAFFNSFALSLGAALFVMLAAVPFAHLLAQVAHDGRRWATRGIRFLLLCVEMPYAVPGVVLALAAILLFLKPLPLLGWSLYNTVWIIFFCYIARFLVLGLRPVASARAQMEPALLEAAQVAGARPLRVLLDIVWPSVAPMAVAGALMVFLTAFNELTVSALLWSVGAETLGVAVFGFQNAGEANNAAALAMLTVLVTAVLMAVFAWSGRRLPAGVVPWRD